MSEKIISMFNNKGGVGKTTILWNLGVSLAAAGQKTLLIDFDPSAIFLLQPLVMMSLLNI
jgi:cellulose biosynthesis protein BcsQ